MKIIKFPKNMDAFTLQKMSETLQKENPEEHFVFLAEGIEWIDLSTADLYRIKEEIEDAIHDHEVISNM